MTRLIFSVFVCLLLLSPVAQAQERYSPSLKLDEPYGSVSDTANAVARKLSAAGYRGLGFVDINPDLRIMAFYKPAWLQDWAMSSPTALFGTVIQIGVIKQGRRSIVSLANPMWRSHLYHMNITQAQAITADLTQLLGQGVPYGMKQGYEPVRIADLRVTPLAYGVEDLYTVAKHPSHASAVTAVEASLKKYHTQVKRLYKLHLPQQGTTLYGLVPQGHDDLLTKLWEEQPIKPAAHAAYTLLVQADGRIQAHHPQFVLPARYPDMSILSLSHHLDGIYAPVKKLLKRVAR
ncbi:hypothetical protein [Magnetococcus sp. PR-3]|uniref:hypothetical protein n=1 Tax=Magnetococcus sp. PR-3 TaxID=3120355 RepID=UPI002FCDEB68